MCICPCRHHDPSTILKLVLAPHSPHDWLHKLTLHSCAPKDSNFLLSGFDQGAEIVGEEGSVARGFQNDEKLI